MRLSRLEQGKKNSEIGQPNRLLFNKIDGERFLTTTLEHTEDKDDGRSTKICDDEEKPRERIVEKGRGEGFRHYCLPLLACSHLMANWDLFHRSCHANCH